MNTGLLIAMASARSAGTPSPPPFDFPDLAGYLADLDASALALADNDPVATWQGTGSVAPVASQGAAPNQPLFKTAIQNAKPAVRFNGTTTFMAVSAVALGTSHTICVAFIPRRAPASFGDIVLCDTTSLGKLFYLYTSGVYYNEGAGNANVTHGLSQNAAAIMTIRRSGTSISWFVNGSQIGTTQTLPGNAAIALRRIGCNPSSLSSVAQIDWLRGVCYDSALSTTDRGNVETKMNALYQVY